MRPRYHVRWAVLAVTFVVFVVVPLLASVFFDVDAWPLAVAWLAVFAIGAANAGLRARGAVTQTLHYDPDAEPRREVDQHFAKPHDEGHLL